MLTDPEIKTFIELIKKLQWPVSPDIFDALCEALIMCPIELAVIRNGNKGPELLLHHRVKDKYFDGTTWHMPGTIMKPGQTPETAFAALIEREVGKVTTEPEYIGTYDIPKGVGFGECARGQERSRFFVVRISQNDTINLNETKKFVPLSEITDDLLISNHQLYVRELRSYLDRI
jgi:ADP-ribose pyrophosphatase YjhB (NUDIX family)